MWSSPLTGSLVDWRKLLFNELLDIHHFLWDGRERGTTNVQHNILYPFTFHKLKQSTAHSFPLLKVFAIGSPLLLDHADLRAGTVRHSGIGLEGDVGWIDKALQLLHCDASKD